ncbi:MAG: response regulator, partial [Acidobacteria bacterium]|nr:response regulator [Acidobacteriota bacterium]
MKVPFRIIVLDDDEHAVTGIVEMLRDSGYYVTAAVTYDAAKRMLALGTYDLLITDVHLRGFNG